MNRQDFEQQFISISDQIWEFAEPRYQEFHSSALQADFLEQEGFTVTRNLGGIATAFSASFGSGHPGIGLLGEYDEPDRRFSRKTDSPSRCGRTWLRTQPSWNRRHGSGLPHSRLALADPFGGNRDLLWLSG